MADRTGKMVTSQENSEELSDDDYGDGDDLGYYDEIDYDEIVGEQREVPESSTSAGTSGGTEDPEDFQYECLEICEVERLLNESVEALCAAIPVTPALAKVLLHNHAWSVEVLKEKYKTDCHRLLVDTHLKPPQPVPLGGQRPSMCPVCARSLPSSEFLGLACGHQFCRNCWTMHCESQLLIGVSTNIECMEPKCRLLAPEDFLYNILGGRPDLRAKYQQFVFQDHVKSQPELRFCPGPNCQIVIRAPDPKAKKVTCKKCTLVFCFSCGMEYHAPTSCEVIKRWLMKCADDSETANYITANTKDCPHCHACIEKNGGCNHMQCTKCKHHFCWMCQGDWKSHGSEYYECSRYKENPAIANENVHVKARAALEKYLFYFERWENHNKSLKLEEQLFSKIQARVSDKTGQKEGTWIDWQFLYRAAQLLTRCRYTLQYTYPYAYYSQAGTRKELFEYQQAQLEKEIEELSWKVERAETTDHGAMERQMHIAELRRRTLLEDFYG